MSDDKYRVEGTTYIRGQADSATDMLVKLANVLEPDAPLVYYRDFDADEFGIIVMGTDKGDVDKRYPTKDERDAELARLQEQLSAKSFGELEIGQVRE